MSTTISTKPATTATAGSTAGGRSSTPPTWARPHRVADAEVQPPTVLFRRITDEWSRVADLPTAPRTIAKWAQTQPALAGVESLTGLLDAIDNGTAARRDAILLALLELAHDGDEMAGKTVLQAMLPKLSCITRSATMRGTEAVTTEERCDLTVDTFWIVMATYPTDRRRASVAANLGLDTLHQLTACTRSKLDEVPAPVRTGDGVKADELGASAAAASEAYGDVWDHQDRDTNQTGPFDDPVADIVVASACDHPTADGSLLSLVTWAASVGAISIADAQMLVRVYAPEPGAEAGRDAIAAGLGITEAALRKRCSRAVQAIIAAVHTDLAA